MKALVLCAGLGTRLGALTTSVPKPMLPICGEPLLAHTLRQLASQGFTEVAVNLHFLPESFLAYFGDGSAFNLRLHYSREDSLLGTAGAVKKLEPFFSDVEDFLVLYGDVLTNQDHRQLVEDHVRHKALATLTLHQRAGSNSLVAMDASRRIVEFLERPSEEDRERSPLPWVNSGVQVLNRRVLPFIAPDRPSDIPRDLVVPLLRKEAIFGFPLSGDRIAVDSEARYRQAERAVASGMFTRRA